METINHLAQTDSIKDTNILDTNTAKDSPQSSQDVETENSDSIKQNINETDHLKYKLTDENKTETTNVQVPIVDEVNSNNDKNEERMDTNNFDADFNESKQIHNEAQQVEVSSQSQPQDMENEEYDMTDVADNDKIILNKCNQVEEDELLEQHNEDDNILAFNENSKTTTDVISIEQEEALLQSDDEDVEMSNYDTPTNSKTLSCEEWKSNDNLNLEKYDAAKSNDNVPNQNKSNLDSLRVDNNDNESHNEVEKYQQELENITTKICDVSNEPSKKDMNIISQPKLRNNTENHRILYQFDLDDSSQESFEKSPRTQSNEDENESVKNLSQNYEKISHHDLPETCDIKDISIEKKSEKEENDIKTEHLSESDCDNSGDGSDVPYPPSKSHNKKESESDSEESKEVASLQCSKIDSPKSEGSTSNEDQYNSDDVNEAKESSSKLSDSTTDNLNTINENVYYSEEQNKNLIHDDSLSSNDVILNACSQTNRNEEENTPLLKINGDRDTKNEYSVRKHIENSNDSYFKNDESTKVMKLRRTSLDTNIAYTLDQKHSSFNLLQKEGSARSFHNKIEESNSLALHTSDTTKYNDQMDGIENVSGNENHLKINDNGREFEGHDNDMASKSSLLLLQSYTNPHEEEASRSSLASSASYSSSTSSSQHLVIDHPMDDVKEEKIKPLKISLKRKYSHVSDDVEPTGPQPKQVHLCDEIGDQAETNEVVKEEQQEIKMSNEFCNDDENMDTSEIADKHDQIDKTPEVETRKTVVALKNIEEQSSFLSNESDLPSSPLKSLLLQQLEKPLVLPNVATNCTDISSFNANSITYSPAEQTALPAPQPVTSTQPITRSVTPGTGVTKYLCFKCKTGSFDNFAALTEHQITCLASHNLFSMGQMATQTTSQLIQAIRQSPINSLKTSINLSSTKLPTLIEPKGTIAPRNQPAISSTKKRYYKCSTCNTFHENWNLFLHIREQHNRHMCLYCLRFFPSAEKLALHLEIKHDLEQNHFNSEQALRSNIPAMEGYALESRFLMCCSCQYIFRENEQFSQHDCSEFIKPCSLCGQKGRHTDQCKANPDSKRFSKLKKKKEKLIQLSERLPPPPPPLPHYSHERNRSNFNVSPITSSKHNFNPTINSNSNFNCDSGQAEKIQQPPTFSSIHNEDSNSSSNMVIDESYNISHIPPAQSKQQENSIQPTNTSFGIETQISGTLLEPDLPPNRQLEEEKIVAAVQPVKLVVPKLKLRVPKQFQKSVDDALSTSDSEDEEVEDEEESHKKAIKNETEISDETAATKICITKEPAAEASKNLLLAESNPGNSLDTELERTSATETATEAGNSQDNVVESGESKSQISAVLMDDDDSLDEPNSNLVRIMQEIERTKLDIQRTKKTSNRHNKPFALPRQPTVSQSSIRTTDRNWSPTPPASPNSRWFTPRRSTLSQGGEEQLQKTPQPQLGLPPPPKQMETTQERRDTIGSDMMDIDETITSQPTQTIICNKLCPLLSENFNEVSENIEEQSCKESMETNQIANVEAPVSVVNNIVLQSECKEISSLSVEPQQDYVKDENKSEIEDIEPKENLLETPENMDITVTKTTNTENTEQIEEKEAEDEANTEIDVCGNKEQEEDIQVTDNEKTVEIEKIDGIEVANEDTVAVDMKLDKPLDKYEIVDFVRICLKTVYPLCLYCNHARRIAVNGKSLVLHMIGNHRFTASVDSITAEELLPATIVTKLISFLPELEEHFFNSTSYCTYGSGAFTHHLNERIFECFQCRFVTSTHKELYLHNRKMHLRTAILCFMCRANFFSFSEILCHICPGVPNKVSVFDVKFRCCLCDLDNIPSPFRLMVHLRKKHFACDVCLEDCRDQSKLSSHVWKHKLHHLCYRCGIAYRNKLDITKHLFWKHGTESTICKRCLQKKWRHVYHFCIPPTTFVCEVCNLCFSKAMYLRVHKRLHSGDLRYPCIEDNCEEKFISRKLLLKHALLHQLPASNALSEKDNYLQNSENKENEFGVTEDTSQENRESNVKLELMEIKKEPLDESEVDSQKLAKESTDELSEKTENTEEKIKSSGTTDSTNDDVKGKNKHSSSNEPRKKRKKSKRSKELLEDLNLTAPNLSESDSSDDSDSDSDSKTKSEIDALPRVNLSPPSETENEEKENKSAELVEPGQVLEIWKNFLKTQQGSSTVEELERLTATNEENKEPKREPIHVACSDHDYCKIEPDPPPPPPPPAPESESKVEAAKDDFKIPPTELTTPGTSPTKRKQSKSPRQLSSRRSDASSSSSGSSSSSDSSCSCGSNCSCSSSDSNSSSSSSSSEDSDSSLASNNSLRKRHRKKSERDRMRKRSESMSPIKQHKLSVSISEVINVDDEATENVTERPISPPKEPLFYESDLETNESETDEEFYDEHPQKLANELLAAKRAQLIAQTRLSPSHNYDIVENSRPSTPSLPEEVTANEKPKVKVKKKKRDRKSSCKAQGLHTNHIAASEHRVETAQAVSEAYQPSISVVQRSSSPTTTLINSVINSHHTQQTNLYTMPQNNIPQTIYALPPPALLTEQSTLTPRPLTMTPYGNSHRMSEGSSCSDADGSLKRSKRQRRPNKFYGYTSDDENLINGPPLMIGSRAFKPQPPPQLTWRKEDLPTPSKSILNNKNKTPRTPKTPAFTGNTSTTTMSSSSSKKKSKTSIISEEKSARKKTSKKKDGTAENKFPPIPTLKIRPSEIGLNTSITNSYTKSENYNTTDDTSSDDDDTMLKGHSNFNSYALNQTLAALPPPIVLPSQPPAPPVPQTTAFNHRIPPALLPNPDFATLQYFKANNIRYPIRPPAGARQPREGESVYCYCRCPYDEVSEMIACDGENCLIEWFHFECVGIMVAPQGKWFCAECRPKYSEELYPSSVVGQLTNV